MCCIAMRPAVGIICHRRVALSVPDGKKRFAECGDTVADVDPTFGQPLVKVCGLGCLDRFRDGNN